MNETSSVSARTDRAGHTARAKGARHMVTPYLSVAWPKTGPTCLHAQLSALEMTSHAVPVRCSRVAMATAAAQMTAHPSDTSFAAQCSAFLHGLCCGFGTLQSLHPIRFRLDIYLHRCHLHKRKPAGREWSRDQSN